MHITITPSDPFYLMLEVVTHKLRKGVINEWVYWVEWKNNKIINEMIEKEWNKVVGVLGRVKK